MCVGSREGEDAAARHGVGVGRSLVGVVEVGGRIPLIGVRLVAHKGGVEVGRVFEHNRRVGTDGKERLVVNGHLHRVAYVEHGDTVVGDVFEANADLIAVFHLVELEHRHLAGNAVAVEIPIQHVGFARQETFNLGAEYRVFATAQVALAREFHFDMRHGGNAQYTRGGIYILAVVERAAHKATERHAGVGIHIDGGVGDKQRLTAIYKARVGGRNIGKGKAVVIGDLPRVVKVAVLVVDYVDAQAAAVAVAGVEVGGAGHNSRAGAYFYIHARVVGVATQVVDGAEVVAVAASRLGNRPERVGREQVVGRQPLEGVGTGGLNGGFELNGCAVIYNGVFGGQYHRHGGRFKYLDGEVAAVGTIHIGTDNVGGRFDANKDGVVVAQRVDGEGAFARYFLAVQEPDDGGFQTAVGRGHIEVNHLVETDAVLRIHIHIYTQGLDGHTVGYQNRRAGRVAGVVERALHIGYVGLTHKELATTHVFKSEYGVGLVGKENTVAIEAVVEFGTLRRREGVNGDIGAVAHTTMGLFFELYANMHVVVNLAENNRVASIGNGRTLERRLNASHHRIVAVELDKGRKYGIVALRRTVYIPVVFGLIAGVGGLDSEVVGLLYRNHAHGRERGLRVEGGNGGMERTGAVFFAAINQLAAHVVVDVTVVAFNGEAVVDAVFAHLGHAVTVFVNLQDERTTLARNFKVGQEEGVVYVERLTGTVFVAQTNHTTGFVAVYVVVHFATNGNAVKAECIGSPNGVGFNGGVVEVVAGEFKAVADGLPRYLNRFGRRAGRGGRETFYLYGHGVVEDGVEVEAVGVAATRAVGYRNVNHHGRIYRHTLFVGIEQTYIRPLGHHAVSVVRAF